jgi:bile acid:Na+ symporter, BASS family
MPSIVDATQWVGPLVLFLLMTTVGLQLTPADFRRVAAAPRAVVGGTVGQIVLLPLLTWGVVAALDAPPVFGAGALIVAVSPGAGISNLLTALARANLALSVTLTAFASVLCTFTLPPLTAAGLRVFLGEDVAVEVPVAMLTAQLVFSLLIPIAVGMWMRARRPDWVARYGPRLQRVTGVAIAALIAFGVLFADTGDLGLADAAAGLVVAGAWTIGAMAIGWGLARGLGLPPGDRFAFLIEFGTRNIAVATIVAMSGLGRLDLALFSGAYVAVGYPIAALAVMARRARVRPVDGGLSPTDPDRGRDR